MSDETIEIKMKRATEDIKVALKLLKTVRDSLDELAKSQSGVFLVKQSVESDLKNARSGLRFGLPYSHCPICVGTGCVTCRNSGWVSKRQWDLIPRTQK